MAVAMAERVVPVGRADRATGAWPLLGRDDVLARLDGAGSVVLVGSAGVGKSRLVADWLDRPENRRRATVVVRATRSTATIPFGAFARWVPERLVDRDDRLGLLQRTAAGLLAAGPDLLVAVDDAQLLDEGSAALVFHLAQHTPARVLVTVRSGEPCPDAIVALWKDGLAERVDLLPLARDGADELTRLALGGPVTATARQRLWRLTEGNPLYLREVLDAARAQGVLARAGGRWDWTGELAGRGRLDELVSDRLGAGGTDERRAVELVALAEPVPVDVLSRLAGPSALAAVERRGVVVVERPPVDAGAAGPVVRLAHPIYSEVVRAGLPTFAARRHHGDLAAAAIAAGYHRQDPLRVATWRLEATDDRAPGDADLFLRASFVAFVVDEYELSVRLARAAERAGAGWRATLQRAEALGPLGRWAEADALTDRLSAPGSPPAARAATARVRAEALVWHRGGSVADARAVIAATLDDLPAGAWSPVLVLAARLAMSDLDLDAAGRLATEAADAATDAGDRLHALTTALVVATFRGHCRAVVDLVPVVTPYAVTLASHDDPVPAGYLVGAYSFASLLAGRIDPAADVFASLLDHEILVTYLVMRGLPTLCLARARLAQGKVGPAVRLSHDVLVTLVGDDNHYGRGNWVVATLAAAAAQAGDRALAAEAIAWIDDHPTFPLAADRLGIQLGRAWLRAAEGSPAEARALALDVADRARAGGARLLEALALVDALRFGGAAGVVDRLEALAAELPGPYLAAAAGFARGLVEGARNGGGGDRLDRAAAGFAGIGARLLAAEAATAAAIAHRAAGRRRDHAAARAFALRLVDECEGASTPLLARLGEEPPAAALTPREREVAELAAHGRSNREIAEVLHVSRRTVDSHLDHAYTKLGITTRHELPAALGLAP